MKNHIRELRKARGMSQGALAELVDTSADQISKLERGERSLTHEWMIRISRALKCDATDLIKEFPTEIPISGVITSGAFIQQLAPSSQPHSFSEKNPASSFSGFPKIPQKSEANHSISASKDGQNFVALRVDGNSMYPAFEDGDLLFYVETQEIDYGCLRKHAIVCLADGRQYVKVLTKGSVEGTFTLTSHNAPPIENATLLWCARISWVKKAN